MKSDSRHTGHAPCRVRAFATVALLGAACFLHARPQEGQELTVANPDGRQYPPRVYHTVRL